MPKKGQKHTAKSKRKISEAKQGIPLSEEHKHSISQTLKDRPLHLKGNKLTEEHKHKIAVVKTGRKYPDRKRPLPFIEEHRRNMSRVKEGKTLRPLTAEHKAKLSQAIKDLWAEHREELLEKLRQGRARGELEVYGGHVDQRLLSYLASSGMPLSPGDYKIPLSFYLYNP
jgi:hypothetical protein